MPSDPVGERVHAIDFEKTDAITGTLPVGARAGAVFRPPGYTRAEAEQRAWRVFKRHHPDENPMSWSIVEVR